MSEYAENPSQTDKKTSEDSHKENTYDQESEPADDLSRRTKANTLRVRRNNRINVHIHLHTKANCTGARKRIRTYYKENIKRFDEEDTTSTIREKSRDDLTYFKAKEQENLRGHWIEYLSCFAIFLAVIPSMAWSVYQTNMHTHQIEEFDKASVLTKQDIFNLKAGFQALITNIKDTEERSHLVSSEVLEQIQNVNKNMSAISEKTQRLGFTSENIKYIIRLNKQILRKVKIVVYEIRFTRRFRNQTMSAISAIQRNVYTTSSAITKTVGRVDGLKNDIDKLDSETNSNMTKLVGKVDGLMKDINKLESVTESNMTKLVGKVDGLKKDIDNLDSQINANMTKIDGKVNGLKKDVDKLDSETESYMTKMDRNIAGLKKDINKLELETNSKMTKMDENIAGLKNDIDKLDSKTNSDMTKLVGKVDGLVKDIDKLDSETESYMTKMDRNTDDLKKDINKLEAETNSKMTKLVGNMTGLKEDIDKLESATELNMTKMFGNMDSLKKDIDKLDSETNSNMTKLDGKVDSLKNDIYKLESITKSNMTQMVWNMYGLKNDIANLDTKQVILESHIDKISFWEHFGFGVMMVLILSVCLVAYGKVNLHKAITVHRNVIDYLIENKEYHLALDSYSILKNVRWNLSQTENTYCVISFEEARHKKHGRIVRYAVEGRGRVKNMLETNYIIKEERDVLTIPNVKVMVICVDRNETNSILETPGQDDKDIRLLTVHACCKMGADVFVIYVGDPGSKDLMAGLLYNTQLTNIVEHFLLKKLEKRGRVISVYEKFTITQRERVAEAIA